MATAALAPYAHLLGTGRLRPLGNAAWPSLAELAALASAGALAAVAAACIKLNVRIPGHAILWMTLPLGLGYMLSPRFGSGAIMAIFAGATGLALSFAGLGKLPAAAWTGIVALGPLLDLAAQSGKTGWRWYAAFALCGLTANLLAFAVRFGVAALGWDVESGRGFLGFWPAAAGSFAACGAVAGLIGAAAWFRLSSGEPRPNST